jgi:DNA-binding MarR family transcriptional regulator
MSTTPALAELADDLPPTASRRWTEIIERISLCSRLLRGGLADRTARRGISEPFFLLLWASAEASVAGMSQSELASTTGLSPAHISGLVEQLRRKGLLDGHRSAPDRRRQLWRLTPAGRATLEGLLKDLTPWAEELDVRVEDVDRRALMGLLNALAEAVGESDHRSFGNRREQAAS